MLVVLLLLHLMVLHVLLMKLILRMMMIMMSLMLMMMLMVGVRMMMMVVVVVVMRISGHRMDTIATATTITHIIKMFILGRYGTIVDDTGIASHYRVADRNRSIHGGHASCTGGPG